MAVDRSWARRDRCHANERPLERRRRITHLFPSHMCHHSSSRRLRRASCGRPIGPDFSPPSLPFGWAG